MHSLVRHVQNYLFPTKENVYRPHLLRRPWLLFFLALTLAAEGFLVSSIVVDQAGKDIFITGQYTSNTASVGASLTQSLKVMVEGLERQMLRVAGDPKDVSTALLASISLLVGVLVLCAFVVHIQIQSHESLLGGAAVATFALLLVLLNLQVLGVGSGGAQSAVSWLAW